MQRLVCYHSIDTIACGAGVNDFYIIAAIRARYRVALRIEPKSSRSYYAAQYMFNYASGYAKVTILPDDQRLYTGSKMGTSKFDIADYLDNSEMITEYLNAVLEEGNDTEIVAAIGHIAKAIGMTKIAGKTGMSRPSPHCRKTGFNC